MPERSNSLTKPNSKRNLEKKAIKLVENQLIASRTTRAASGGTTDFYLASLADQHGMNWATLDENSKHQAAFVLPA